MDTNSPNTGSESTASKVQERLQSDEWRVNSYHTGQQALVGNKRLIVVERIRSNNTLETEKYSVPPEQYRRLVKDISEIDL